MWMKLDPQSKTFPAGTLNIRINNVTMCSCLLVSRQPGDLDLSGDRDIIKARIRAKTSDETGPESGSFILQFVAGKDGRRGELQRLMVFFS